MIAIPYNVDRPARRFPYVTYGLMGLNIFIFLMTVLAANINLPTDRVEGQKAIAEILAKQGDSFDDEGGSKTTLASPSATPDATPTKSQGMGAFMQAGGTGSGNAAGGNAANNAADNKSDDSAGSSDDSGKSDKMAQFMRKLNQQIALEVAFKEASDANGFKRFYQIEHAYDSIVMEPHYSALTLFAYQASNPTIWGMLGSMFLHGGFEHLLGNMLFLWVFGRALEDTLGPAIYLGAYFLCGIAATLLYHIMTVHFTPQSAAIPSYGASGAIAGVLGLFFLRFYRTPVRIFWVRWRILFFFALVWGPISYIVYQALGQIGVTLTFIVLLVLLLIFGQDWAWASLKVPSMWAIGVWLVLFNLLPGILSLFSKVKSGGVANWAHIGGFLCGLVYSAMIGSQKEAKAEYLIDDAQASLAKNNAGNALEYTEELLRAHPDNPDAYELLADAYDQKNRDDDALDAYEKAIELNLQRGNRDAAARVYMSALKKHPSFIMPAPVQYNIAAQLAKNFEHEAAAENLAKIPFTFPESAESELSLLRAAQIYVEHLNQVDMGVHLLNVMLERYPDTQWMTQVQRVYKMADFKVRSEAEAQEQPMETHASPPPVSTRPQAQSPQFKK